MATPAYMSTKVKGLLKGLRYISQIFDEKEEEMEIGNPTDVKHVAHIGWDGPSAASPSWMTGFKDAPELASGPLDSIEEVKSPSSKLSYEGTNGSGPITQDLTLQNIKEKEKKHKSRRKPSTGTGSPLNSPTRRDSDSKHSRRHRSSSNTSMSSPAQESSGSTRHERRHHSSSAAGGGEDLPAIPKQSRRRKSKGDGSSGGGSTRSPRSKGPNSLTDPFSLMDLGSESEIGHELKT